MRGEYTNERCLLVWDHHPGFGIGRGPPLRSGGYLTLAEARDFAVAFVERGGAEAWIAGFRVYFRIFRNPDGIIEEQELAALEARHAR